MKPPPFEYFAPSSLDECVALLASHGDDAKLLAGGQSLVPLMNLRLAGPAVLIDLNRIGDLAYIGGDDHRLAIGAMTRTHDVATSALVRRRAPLLAEAASLVGYPAIRRRGTIGGSLAHADPVAELPCAALALDAEFDVVGPQGRRTIAARDFFVTYFTPALDPAEVVTEIRFAAAGDGERWSFLEFARKTGDFAVAAVAVRLPVAGGVVAGARVALAGVADRPLRAAAAEMALEGRPIDALEPDAVVSAVLEDLHETGADERRVAGVLARRALAEAIDRTEEAR